MNINNLGNIRRFLLITIFFVSVFDVSSLKADDHTILVSTFSKQMNEGDLSELHADWKIKVWTGTPDVQVLKDRDNDVLRLRSHQSSIAVHKSLPVNLKHHSQLSWEWKVNSLPKHADARTSNRDDQAAGLYVVFPRFPAFFNSRVIGYVWDTNAPVGTVLQSQNNAQVHYIVMRSGQTDLGKWKNETRDVLTDYNRIFGEAPPMVGGVSLMIDTDHTQSSAESYFGEIRFGAHTGEALLQQDSIQRVTHTQAGTH